MTTTKITQLTDQEITTLAEKAIAGAMALPESEVSVGWSRLDQLCLPIMDALGVELGDLAAQFWSGSDDSDADDTAAVESYIRWELDANAREASQ